MENVEEYRNSWLDIASVRGYLKVQLCLICFVMSLLLQIDLGVWEDEIFVINSENPYLLMHKIILFSYFYIPL